MERAVAGTVATSPVMLDGIGFLLAQAPVVLFAFDTDGVVTFSQGEGPFLLGEEAGAGVGRSIFEAYANSPGILDAARAALSGLTVRTIAEVCGHMYTIEYMPMREAAGNVTGVLGLAVEVTAGQHTADLLDCLDVVIWRAHPCTMEMSFVSGRAVQLLGYPQSEWLSRPVFWEDHLQPDEKQHTLALCHAVARDGQERSAVHRFTCADGRQRWFRTTVRRVAPNADGQADIVGIMLDVTERIASQTVLTQTEERFRLLFEQLPAIVYTIDRELRFTTGIGAALAPLGLSWNQALSGISLYQYFQTTDSNHPQIAAHLRAIGGETVDCEATWVGRTYALHLDPFRDRSGQIVGAIGVALDITDRVRIEAERDRLLTQERQARRVAEQAVQARDDFLAVAAHELFTPITALKSALQVMLLTSEQGTPPSPTMLSTAERQTRRLATLVADLLNVARIQSGHLALTPTTVDLVSLVEKVAKDFADELERTRTVLRLTAPRPVVGHWDPHRLQQVVANLLSNAVRYAAGAPVEIAVEERAGKAILRVRDHGIGIAADRLPHIFDRFERAVSSQHYGGLGLGLYIVRSIVEAHDGRAQVESEPGRGTTFTIELPLAGPP